MTAVLEILLYVRGALFSDNDVEGLDRAIETAEEYEMKTNSHHL